MLSVGIGGRFGVEVVMYGLVGWVVIRCMRSRGAVLFFNRVGRRTLFLHFDDTLVLEWKFCISIIINHLYLILK